MGKGERKTEREGLSLVFSRGWRRRLGRLDEGVGWEWFMELELVGNRNSGGDRGLIRRRGGEWAPERGRKEEW